MGSQVTSLQAVETYSQNFDSRNTLEIPGSISEIKLVNAGKVQSFPDVVPFCSAFSSQNPIDEVVGQESDVGMNKLRAHNNFLRKQIKDLNERLTALLAAKDKAKSKKKSDLSQALEKTSEEVLKKQLQNAYKQIDILKKELKIATTHPEGPQVFERIRQLEDAVAEKDLRIEKLLMMTKTLEKVVKDQEREVTLLQKEDGSEKKIQSYHDEIRGLREKMANMHAVNRHNETSFKKQQLYLVNLTRQYRLTCEKLGIPSSSKFCNLEELEDVILKKGSKIHEDVENECTENSPARGKEKILRKVVVIKNTRSSSVIQSRNKDFTIKSSKEVPCRVIDHDIEENYKTEIASLQTKVYMLESERKQIKSKLKEKENNISINLTTRDSQRSMTQHRSLTRVNLQRSSDSKVNSTNFSTIPTSVLDTSISRAATELEVPAYKEKQNKIPLSTSTIKENMSISKSKLEKKPILYTKAPVIRLRKSTGGRTKGSNIEEFCDKNLVKDLMSSRIVKLNIWRDDKFIYGIQAIYGTPNNENIVGQEHINSDMKIKAKYAETIEIDSDDEICYIAGRCEQALTFLEIKTAKGVIKQFGQKIENHNEFKIVVEHQEKLAAMNGALCSIKQEKIQDENSNEELITQEEGKVITVLGSIGFTLVKEAKL